MTKYISKSGKSFGVIGYDAGKDYISVQFQNKSVYKYSIQSCGKLHVENMKRLAKQQMGLSTYISQHKPFYETKIK